MGAAIMLNLGGVGGDALLELHVVAATAAVRLAQRGQPVEADRWASLADALAVERQRRTASPGSSAAAGMCFLELAADVDPVEAAEHLAGALLDLAPSLTRCQAAGELAEFLAAHLSREAALARAARAAILN
jgi:hypothetical protein